MRPAREIGGDFYDYFLIDEDHLALAVADVSGKGIPAALYMTLSKTLLKNTALHEKSPARVLREVNARLAENGRTDMSVAVWLGILELSTGLLVWSDAGHVRPLVCQNGSWAYAEKDDSSALGLASEKDLARQRKPPYSDHRLQLQPGDLLFQCTDGIPEAMDPNKTAFGEERLLALLSRLSFDELEEASLQIRQELDRFVQTAPQLDDITMLLVRYNGAEG